MIVTIWRHGEAGSAATDRLRELTDRGTEDIGFGCHQFHKLCEAADIPHPELLLYSEWVRTTQTADIIGMAFNHAAREKCAALTPGRRPADVETALIGSLQSSPELQHALLVSHQPLVSSLVDYLLGDYGLVAPLAPGGLATLEMEVPAAGCASLRFSAQPPNYEAQM
jgi:phosphohistidine phosphatase SixA